MYGAADGPPRREDDPKAPLTAYARSKLAVEEALRMLDAPEMRVSSLRFATACGMSSRLRLDLMLNDFVAGALSTGEITVLSDGTPWRPLIDVVDMARAIDWAISRPRERGGAFLAVNVGRDDHNVQVRDVAHAVADLMPGTRVSINAAAAPDRRSYRVDFGLFARLAPEAVPVVTLPESIERLRVDLEPIVRSDGGFDRASLVRLAALRRHLAAGRLGRDLRWVRAA
jgi:nucleoside-diphosphate-sugar epimerase